MFGWILFRLARALVEVVPHYSHAHSTRHSLRVSWGCRDGILHLPGEKFPLPSGMRRPPLAPLL